MATFLQAEMWPEPALIHCCERIKNAAKLQNRTEFPIRVRILIHNSYFIIHYEAARGQLRPRQRALQAPLAVLRQTPAARHPSEGPLHDPAAVENRGPLGFLGFFHDLKIGTDAEILERGRQLLSPAAAVRPPRPDPKCGKPNSCLRLRPRGIEPETKS